MAKVSKEVFDVGLFKRLLTFIKPYNHIFGITLLAVFGLAIFGAIRPKVLQLAIDDNIAAKLDVGFLNHMLVYGGLLLLEVISNLLFIYFASWLGQSVVRDIRVKLFEHILKFKMKYYDNSSVGLLITRAVTDMERIADIFGQGLFMIFSDLLKMFLVACVMTYMNWKLSIIVFFYTSCNSFCYKDFSEIHEKSVRRS